MTKGELLKELEGMSDDTELFIVSKDYDENDDMTWEPSYQTEISSIEVGECGDVYVRLETSEFFM